MIIPDIVFNRLKEENITNGVFLMVSNKKQSLRDEAPSFAHSLLDYTQRDVALNEKIFVTDTESISVDLLNQFIEFESKKAVGVKSKILIMHDVELIKEDLSDKLLKTLEDHNSDSLIILTTSSLGSVSRTIRSRCMIFKEFVDAEDYFIHWKNKYLNFITQIKEGDYLKIPDIIKEMENLGPMNVIRAMFVNLDNLDYLKIAENALSAYLTGSKDQQVYTYLVYSSWTLENNLRRWA